MLLLIGAVFGQLRPSPTSPDAYLQEKKQTRRQQYDVQTPTHARAYPQLKKQTRYWQYVQYIVHDSSSSSSSSSSNDTVRVFIGIHRYLKGKDRTRRRPTTSNKHINIATITTSTPLTSHLPAVSIDRVATNNPEELGSRLHAFSPSSTKITLNHLNLYYSDVICLLTLFLSLLYISFPLYLQTRKKSIIIMKLSLAVSYTHLTLPTKDGV